MSKIVAQYTIRDDTDITVSASAPADPAQDQLWLDTSLTPNQMKRFDGSIWVVVNDVQVGGRNYVRDSANKLLAAGNSNNHYWTLYTGLEQGQPYVLSVGSITRLGGRASQVQAMLYDLTASAAGPSYTLSVTQALQQVQITPPTQAGRTWSLLMYIGLNGETAGNVLRFERVQLEKGLQRTDWTPAPEDPVAALTTSNGITINSQGVFIDTNRFDLNLLDNTGESVLSMSAAGIGGFQQLRAQHIQTTQLLVDGRPWRQEETVNLYVNGASGNDSNSGASAARAFLTIQAALDSLPKCLNASVEINIASGSTYTPFKASGFYGGGSLYLHSADAARYQVGGIVDATDCALQELIIADVVAQRFNLHRCVDAFLFNAATNTNVTSVDILDCVRARIKNCDLSTTGVGIWAEGNSQVYIENTQGSCDNFGTLADGGAVIHFKGACPYGANASTTAWAGGVFLNAGTPTQSPSKPINPTIREVTTTFTATRNATWRNGGWREDAAGADRAVQSLWTAGSSNNIGCFFFPFGSTLSGKTIKSAILNLHRYNGGGYSSAVNPRLGVHNLSTPDGAPTASQVTTLSPGLAWNERRGYNVTALMQLIANGSAKNLCLYDQSGSVYNYLIVQDLPTLTVIYT